MSRKVNARVDDSDLGGKYFRTEEDRFRVMKSIFKRIVDDFGILTEFKQKSRHESQGEKRRRKKKEAVIKKRKEMYKQKHTGE